MNLKLTYISPTGGTKRIAKAVYERLAEKIFPDSAPGILIAAYPTYAGRLPNKFLPRICEDISALAKSLSSQDNNKHACEINRPIAIAIVTFGNRSYDNSLAELVKILGDSGFSVIAAGAFLSEHPFSHKLATGRPNEEDLALARKFASRCADIIASNNLSGDIDIPGDYAAPYYVPKGINGEPTNFLKATPLTDRDKCTSCGTCLKVCPMGVIDSKDVTRTVGSCIKCHACIKSCPTGARSFNDPAFLSHVSMLEANFTEPKSPKMFYIS